MEMKAFLGKIEYAVSFSLDAVWREHERLEEIQRFVGKQSRVVTEEKNRNQFIAMNADDAGDVAMATGGRWDTYFGSENDLHAGVAAAHDAENLITVHTFSRSAQSGSILQYAKQGISLAHGGLDKCPEGRSIGSQSLKNIVWQGRNQAMHWEEGDLHEVVKNCFNALFKDFGKAFLDFHSQSLAFEVIGTLQWHEFADFEKDMLSLS